MEPDNSFVYLPYIPYHVSDILMESYNDNVNAPSGGFILIITINI